MEYLKIWMILLKKLNQKKSSRLIIYMNDWKSIFLMYDEDIDTDDELLLLSETESDDEEDYKQTSTKKPKVNI